MYGMRRFPGLSVEVQDALEEFAEYLDAAGFVILEESEAKEVRGPACWYDVPCGAKVKKSERRGVPLEWREKAWEVLRDYLQYSES